MTSVDKIRPYFRKIALAQGFHEWSDLHNFNNIPSTSLDKSFHLGVVSDDNIDIDQRDQTWNAEITVRLFFKGYRKPESSFDAFMATVETYRVACVNQASVNEAGGNICRVAALTSTPVPIDDTNDNSTRVDMVFGVDFLVEP